MTFTTSATFAILLLGAAPGALGAQGAARIGPFDPQSGRFGTSLPGASRVPDTLAVPVARAWEALDRVYRELGIALSVVDTQSHVLGALRVAQRRPVGGERLSRLLECGSGPYGPNAERYSVQLTALTHLEAAGDGRVAVDTRVGGTASPNGLNSTVTCGTSGVLEEKIADMLRKTLGQ